MSGDKVISDTERQLIDRKQFVEAALQRFLRHTDIGSLAPAQIARDAFFDCASVVFQMFCSFAEAEDEKSFMRFMDVMREELQAHFFRKHHPR